MALEKSHVFNVCFLGAGTVNFGYGDCPWNHSKRLEQLGGVSIVAIVDPLTDKAQAVLEDKLSGSHAHFYKNCHVYGDMQTAMEKAKIDVTFIGTRVCIHFPLNLYFSHQVCRHFATDLRPKVWMPRSSY